LAQLEVTSAAGRVVTLAADEGWVACASGVVSDDLYDGQLNDLRWTEPDLWTPVGPHEPDPARVIVAPTGPPVRVTETIVAQRIWRSPSGKLLVDFGQNVVGWVRMKVGKVREGQRIEIRHAEVLEHKELGVRPLRSARCTDAYICGEAVDQVLEPSLTFHGFRYTELEGVDEADIAEIVAVVIGSDMRRTGWFDSSNELLNRLHENVVWGMRGNFVDVPTDCSQRDGRLGWTGDIAAFAPTALFLFDCAGLLEGWMDDVAADQRHDGSVPFVVPNVLPGSMSAAAWGDAATLVPAAIAERTGDLHGIGRHLETMSRWVDYQAQVSTADGLWSGGFQFGDWLDPTAPPDEPYRAQADPDVIATAYAIRSAQLTAAVAERAGDRTRAASAAHRADMALQAFRREFVTANGRVLSDSPTVYALSLAWDLLPEGVQRTNAANRLADLVRAGGFRISTGFVGTPLINHVLAATGNLDVAYRLLMQTGCPSWLYSVTMGATTVWERWDSMLPDGSINPGQMTSFNHYALGAIADFLHCVVGGLSPEEPGYRTLRIAPRPGGGLTSASVRHQTPYGLAEVAWALTDGHLDVTATVPVGAAAIVDLPGRAQSRVGHGAHRWSVEVDDSDARPPSTVRELLDDGQLWPQFVDGAVNAGVGGMVHLVDEPSVADRLGPFLNAPVSQIPDALTLGGGDPGREALVALLSDLKLTAP
jgi:alpha-L-rhamnosidase